MTFNGDPTEAWWIGTAVMACGAAARTADTPHAATMARRQLGVVSEQQRSRHRIAVLPRNTRAALAARSVVRRQCELWEVDASITETATACASELAANAEEHARWSVSDPSRMVLWLVLALSESHDLIEVKDPDDRLPVVGCGVDWDGFDLGGEDEAALPERGYGLFTVSARVREAGGALGAVLLPEGGKAVFVALAVDGFAQHRPAFQVARCG